MRTTLYMTNAVLYLSSTKLRAILAVLESLDWPEPEPVTDIKELAAVTNGRFNPTGDFVLVMSNNAIIRDVFDLVAWINQQGLRPL